MSKESNFHPNELANSKRIYKSATPKYTADWYLKWISSVFVLAAMSIRGMPEFQSHLIYCWYIWLVNS